MSENPLLIMFKTFFLILGGALGLFTGMSILSMVEIVFWIAKIPVSFYKRN